MTKEATELTTAPASNSPVLVQLMAQAMGEGKGPEYLRELLAVRREWEADEARKAFNIAKHSFQSRCPIIEKGDVAHKKEYARMDRIWRTIRPLITECRLTTTWQVCRLESGNICHIEGKLAHADGHEEALVMDVPLPELVPGQNKAQQMGSAYTYAKRYATCAALGIETGKDDDDAHAAGTEFMTADQIGEIEDLYQAARGMNGFNEKAFFGWLGVDAIADVPANRYADVRAMLKKKLGAS